MERNHIKQYKWRGRVSSLGLSYQGTIRPHIASDHTSRSSCEFNGGFSKGTKRRQLNQVWNKSMSETIAFCIVSGDRKRKCRIRFHPRFVGDTVWGNEELQFDRGWRSVCGTALCNCCSARKPFAGRDKQKVCFYIKIFKGMIVFYFTYIWFVAGFWICRKIDTLKCWLLNIGTKRRRPNVWILMIMKELLWKVWVSRHPISVNPTISKLKVYGWF